MQNMHVILNKSPAVDYSYRVVLPNKRSIDFGSSKVEYYTSHKNPGIMRKQLADRGAKIPYDLRMEEDPHEIQLSMLFVDSCIGENWGDMNTRDFWVRWLLMSYPTMTQAKLFMTMRKGVLFMPTADNFFYVD